MTIAIFRPDAHVESTTVDGDVSDLNDAIWATLRAAAGSAAADIGSAKARLFATTTPDVWSELYRIVLLFDISALPANTIIQDFLLQLDIATVAQTLAGQSLVLVEHQTITDTELVNGDFAVAKFITGTPLSSTVALSGISVSQNLEIPLTQAGKDYIQAAADGDGIVRFGIMLESDRANVEPTWASGELASVVISTADTALNDAPELILTYAIPAGGTLGGQSGGMALLNL
jgi:hypothetical protein